MSLRCVSSGPSGKVAGWQTQPVSVQDGWRRAVQEGARKEEASPADLVLEAREVALSQLPGGSPGRALSLPPAADKAADKRVGGGQHSPSHGLSEEGEGRGEDPHSRPENLQAGSQNVL